MTDLAEFANKVKAELTQLEAALATNLDFPIGHPLHDQITAWAAALRAEANKCIPVKASVVVTSPNNTFKVYTDGGCHGNPGPTGAGVVVLCGATGSELTSFGVYLDRGTNQTAELSAAIHGLRATPTGASVTLLSDSQYTLKGISEWRAGWERNNWQNSKKEPVANKALWQELFKEVDCRRVSTEWVKGHNDDPFNEKCDQLATRAITRRNSH